MRVLAALALSLTLITPFEAYGQSIRSKCLSATNSGDATINCQKASYLLQQKQLEVLFEIRDVIAERSNRTLSAIATNTASTTGALKSIMQILEPWSRGPANYFVVRQPQDITETRFECIQEVSCEDEAKTIADELCKRLGFTNSHAQEFDRRNIAKGQSRITWVVCRK